MEVGNKVRGKGEKSENTPWAFGVRIWGPSWFFFSSKENREKEILPGSKTKSTHTGTNTQTEAYSWNTTSLIKRNISNSDIFHGLGQEGGKANSVLASVIL